MYNSSLYISYICTSTINNCTTPFIVVGMCSVLSVKRSLFDDIFQAKPIEELVLL